MQSNYKPLRSKSYSVPCELCSVGSLCIPMLVNNKLHTVLDRKCSYTKDQILIEENTPFTKFFIIHSGALKTYITTADGNEHINGFYLPGDIVGLDSISTKVYNYTIKALNNVAVCELNYEELMSLIEVNKTVRDMIFKLLSTDIYNYQKLLLCYSQKKADERLAFFIYSLYKRYEKRGHTSLNIKLSMSRTDIANYLGLTIETVSRILSKFQEQDILSVKGKYIFIKNLNALIVLGK
ncbi:MULTISPECIES: helix-turn-helix domain-containing protein [unclassified Gilliamella]|uniref:helix-turn-helix domain-containing protein n=1 Tax=unclassified Gilliamella TaxID=2685620 RepID=UPI00226A7475|nr:MULTISPECIES: helix-turn-helix domain-containing protein [unclassified Gilliamella]MCX8642466.1 helix-turn-helix domain-containing protein [Gilliamella sp. B3835]MCX8706316.1 helix-turn-helix domain-containing protein [Gilliamella sp. B3783]MCX8709784.1 helix-turn-helix domain-containing protein [Gilliamella sp. B3780]MCX8714367.1 helix-turn-helix domain-containing protein [Gilliamella sp. B3781]MCX8717048.1 helix-turn-helix domain-containing protein [Gilliamella sp. B3784]